MIAAALIERHPLLRLGLSRVLKEIGEIGEVVCLDPAEVALRGHPEEVRLLLLGLTGQPQVDQAALEQALAKLPSRHVLLLHEPVAAPALQHPRIDGSIEKTAGPELISAAVQLVLAGGKCFPPARDYLYALAQAGTLAATPTRPAEEPSGESARTGAGQAGRTGSGQVHRPGSAAVAVGASTLGITPRQFEVLMLLARGLSLKKVGRVLGISVATVKSHASATYRRLDANNKQQAIHTAISRGADLRGDDER